MTTSTPTGTTGAATDDRWAAGFEMGRLDQQLAARVLRDQKVGLTIRATNREQAAVIARRHGYELHIQEVEEPDRLWVEFWPAAPRRGDVQLPWAGEDARPWAGRRSS